jgi:large subunit ribosomal protein L20
MKYSTFINGLLKAKITIDRKVLAKLALENQESFKILVKQAKESLGQK